MTRLRRADLLGALAVVREWDRARSMAELESLAVNGLRRLVPCDAVGWNQIDPAGKTVRALVDPPDIFTEPTLSTLARLIDQNPIVTYVAGTGDGSPVAISDFLGVRAYHRLELYADLYRSIGVEDQLAFAVETGGLMTGVAFNRSRRSFTERDRDVLTLLRPHLVLAYQNVRGRAIARERLAALERGLAEDGRAVLELGPHGVETSSDSARELIRRWSGTAPLPIPPAGHTVELARDGVRLRVHRLGGDLPLLLLDETRTAPDPARIRELGLTAREGEILGLAARGLSDAQIADRLVVSVRTVEKHLENVYRKLEVGGRRQAVSVVLGSAASAP